MRNGLFYIRKSNSHTLADYRVTVIAIELFTLYVVASYIWDDLDLKLTSRVADFLFDDWVLLRFLVLFILAAMFVESLFINEIFCIVTGIFCLCMPVWIIDFFYRDDTKYMRFFKVTLWVDSAYSRANLCYVCENISQRYDAASVYGYVHGYL